MFKILHFMCVYFVVQPTAPFDVVVESISLTRGDVNNLGEPIMVQLNASYPIVDHINRNTVAICQGYALSGHSKRCSTLLSLTFFIQRILAANKFHEVHSNHETNKDRSNSRLQNNLELSMDSHLFALSVAYESLHSHALPKTMSPNYRVCVVGTFSPRIAALILLSKAEFEIWFIDGTSKYSLSFAAFRDAIAKTGKRILERITPQAFRIILSLVDPLFCNIVHLRNGTDANEWLGLIGGFTSEQINKSVSATAAPLAVIHEDIFETTFNTQWNRINPPSLSGSIGNRLDWLVVGPLLTRFRTSLDSQGFAAFNYETSGTRHSSIVWNSNPYPTIHSVILS